MVVSEIYMKQRNINWVLLLHDLTVPQPVGEPQNPSGCPDWESNPGPLLCETRWPNQLSHIDQGELYVLTELKKFISLIYEERIIISRLAFIYYI